MTITMNHGSGGRETTRLIDELFLSAFGHASGNGTQDAAILSLSGRLAFTTDSFVVQPLFFPGGDIGKLAVCGTVNDLLTTGAVPKYLSASFILEEGLTFDCLHRVTISMAHTAAEAGVAIVTGDTKVVPGSGGLYITTTGIGDLIHEPVTFAAAAPGDALILTGRLGDHHASIMSARLGITNDIHSDAAPLCAMITALQNAAIPLSGMRDITRGGLATVLWEIATHYGLGAILEEHSLPISEQVVGFCSILGLDPLYMSNEGTMLIAVPLHHAPAALSIIRAAPYGHYASQVGIFTSDRDVILHTTLGGTRVLPPLSGESLPRIC